MDLKLIAQHLVPALRASLHAPGLCLTGLDGGRPLDEEQREPWLKIKYGVTRPDDWIGVVPATAPSWPRHTSVNDWAPRGSGCGRRTCTRTDLWVLAFPKSPWPWCQHTAQGASVERCFTHSSRRRAPKVSPR